MITIKYLTKRFEDRALFRNTELTFENGKVYALTGSSGSGKTTLLNIVALLESYNDGDITYNNVPMKKMNPSKFFRNELGYLFQNFGLLESNPFKKI